MQNTSWLVLWEPSLARSSVIRSEIPVVKNRWTLSTITISSVNTPNVPVLSILLTPNRTWPSIIAPSFGKHYAKMTSGEVEVELHNTFLEYVLLRVTSPRVNSPSYPLNGWASGITSPRYQLNGWVSGINSHRYPMNGWVSGINSPRYPLDGLASAINSPRYPLNGWASGITSPRYLLHGWVLDINSPRYPMNGWVSGMNSPQVSAEWICLGYKQPQVSTELMGLRYKQPQVSAELTGLRYKQPQVSAELVGFRYKQPQVSAEWMGLRYKVQKKLSIPLEVEPHSPYSSRLKPSHNGKWATLPHKHEGSSLQHTERVSFPVGNSVTFLLLKFTTGFAGNGARQRMSHTKSLTLLGKPR